MAEEGPGLGDRISGAVDRAKTAVGGKEDAGQAEGRVKVVREALRVFGEGEHGRFFEVFEEEVEWVAPAGEKFPGAGTHRGRDTVRDRFVGDIERGFPAFGFRPDRYLEAEPEQWVVTLGAFVGEGSRGSFDVPGAVLWQFDGDKIARVRIYADSDAFPEPVKEENQEGEDERPEREEEQPEGQEREDERPEADQRDDQEREDDRQDDEDS